VHGGRFNSVEPAVDRQSATTVDTVVHAGHGSHGVTAQILQDPYIKALPQIEQGGIGSADTRAQALAEPA
jgi:hypothetical protein